jgi:hypothetical protein
MKIAVCFSGQYRTAKECAPNLKKFFSSQKHEVDFFIHTWDTTSYKNFNGTNVYPQRDRFITEEEIEFLKKTYEPKGIKVESHSNYINKYVNNGFGGGLELWYSFYKSMSLKKMFERKNNFRYDVVIKIRLDCMFENINNFDNHITDILSKPKNTIATFFKYASDWKDRLTTISANDVFFIGTSVTMDMYSNFFIDKKNYDKKNNTELCNNIGYGYTQYMHTFFKNIEVTYTIDDPFVLRDMYKHLAKEKFSKDCIEKISQLDGYYYSYYKSDPNGNFYVYKLFDKKITNFEDWTNKVYLDEYKGYKNSNLL